MTNILYRSAISAKQLSTMSFSSASLSSVSPTTNRPRTMDKGSKELGRYTATLRQLPRESL